MATNVDIASGVCPYCGGPNNEPIGISTAERQVGECPACKTVHHVACWRANLWNGNHGCTTWACRHSPQSSDFVRADLSNVRTLDDRKRRIQEALTRLQVALASSNDDTIADAWQKHKEILDGQPLPEADRRRIVLAQKRRKLFADLVDALTRRDDAAAVAIWSGNAADLMAYPPAKARHSEIEQATQRLSAIGKLAAAMAAAQDEHAKDILLDSLWKELQPVLGDHPSADPYRARIKLAQDRLKAAASLLEAIKRGNDAQISARWQKHKGILQGYSAVSSHLSRIEKAEQYQRALADLRDAVKGSTPSDVNIAQVWERLKGTLAEYEPAQEYIARVELAHSRVAALTQLRESLSKGEDASIVRTFHQHVALLEPCIDYTASERAQVQQAVERLAATATASVREALSYGDDQAIEAAYLPHKDLFASVGALRKEEIERAELAVERIAALRGLREAITLGRTRKVVEWYAKHETLLKPCRNFTLDERRRVASIREQVLIGDVRQAIKAGDDEALVARGHAALAASCSLSPEELMALNAAQQRVSRLIDLRTAIAAKDDIRIALAYDEELLGKCRSVTAQDKARVELALTRAQRLYPLRIALALDDDRLIANLYSRAIFDDSHLLTEAEEQRCELAEQRVKALEQLRQALGSDADEGIIAAHDDALLASSSLLTPTDKHRIEQARQRQWHKDMLRKAMESQDPCRIADAYTAMLEARLNLPNEFDLGTILDACRIADGYRELEAALADEPARSDQIVAEVGSWIMHKAPHILTTTTRQRVRESQQRVGMLHRLRSAINSKDTQRIRVAYQPNLFGGDVPIPITSEEQLVVAEALSS